MRDWFRRRSRRSKPLAEMTPEELEAALDGHPELALLLRHTLGLMQFAPARTAEAVLARVGGIVDDVLRRHLSPEEEHAFVMREMEAVRRELLTGEGQGARDEGRRS